MITAYLDVASGGMIAALAAGGAAGARALARSLWDRRKGADAAPPDDGAGDREGDRTA
jgi:hypothetical protein